MLAYINHEGDVIDLSKVEDGEILGLDADGCIIQWNGDDLETYNCGETPEEFGVSSIRDIERGRLRIGLLLGR